ncbi:hypothetical protein [Moorena sp. SIOASIH]|nr:hypothetical protein [Moorena sp. SIOASIH]
MAVGHATRSHSRFPIPDSRFPIPDFLTIPVLTQSLIVDKHST